MVIFKFELSNVPNKVQGIELPEGAEFLSCAMQG
jgi:hypothetical protein